MAQVLYSSDIVDFDYKGCFVPSRCCAMASSKDELAVDPEACNGGGGWFRIKGGIWQRPVQSYQQFLMFPIFSYLTERANAYTDVSRLGLGAEL